jgi:hypothetical protein
MRTENHGVGGSIPPLGTITLISHQLRTSHSTPHGIDNNEYFLILTPSAVSMRIF